MLRGFLKCEECTLGVDPEQTVKIRLSEIENGLTDQFDARIRNDNVATAEFIQGSSKQARSMSA
jgi:hypothetical protein